MIITIISILSAIVLTYAVSRITFRSFGFLTGMARLVAAHLVSLAVLVLLVGWLRASMSAFAFGHTLVLFLPALVWFVLDWARGKGERR